MKTTGTTALMLALHARVEELEAMLDAVGAGGVSAQRITQAANHIAQDRKMVAVPVEVPKVGSAWRHKNGNAYRVVAIANNCDAHFSERYPVTVVYQGENGKMWARRADDWHRSMTHDSAAPATAPVVLPEPGINTASHAGFRVIGYTEQQVRELLDKALSEKSDALFAAIAHGSDSHREWLKNALDAWFSGKDIPKEISPPDSQNRAEVQEPFGYFKAEPFGWRDCAETDEGAVALYEAPQPQADARDAERYRWLRSQPLESDVFCITIWRKGTDGFGDDLRLEKLDAAIDAAIAASKEQAK